MEENNERNDLYSKSIRAGKRTYFFDVKATKSNEYYLTLTESKKRFVEEGKFTYEKHKIFLYREDFEKFVDALNEAISFVKEKSPVSEHHHHNHHSNGQSNHAAAEVVNEFTNVKFEDLDK